MPNLEFLDNVVHQGIILKKGMIVSDSAQGLSLVGQNLIDRKLARETNQPATHSAALVNGLQEAMAVDSSENGQKPKADDDAARKAAAQARQEAADREKQQQIADQASSEDGPVRLSQQPHLPAEPQTDEQPAADETTTPAGETNTDQPSAEQIAAAASQEN